MFWCNICQVNDAALCYHQVENREADLIAVAEPTERHAPSPNVKIGVGRPGDPLPETYANQNHPRPELLKIAGEDFPKPINFVFGDNVFEPQGADWFEQALDKMLLMNRKKRKDYAVDGSPFSNFEDTALNMGLEGFGRKEACLSLIFTKIARIRSLRQNGRINDTANESVVDTYYDLAVYATILYSMVLEETSGDSNST